MPFGLSYTLAVFIIVDFRRGEAESCHGNTSFEIFYVRVSPDITDKNNFVYHV